ncbi:bifunctional GNAT family N-acetyltransferase/carbon-nitrogen hydrolase family protein [Neolewinella lacunae]|uniref:GNAT family N-acetyltransferase n=1 Tax=Neolewinella lacunae TaxID=1517758 RepID=A0A923PMK7_9BACT|nr:bifunctional GNAT family N-acetyltransferase/carbon-nitrogen hydrolase family protein [Neolewinella lacunae]MBC6993963.1 GNAT family N-acetyltransferase [Neolewinella lacunae]MDN3634956.1 bifunctional GNAT family N-acetyltransferase/carbon-nitrogen hydrolase family protein [Neolewinella lacunae]
MDTPHATTETTETIEAHGTDIEKVELKFLTLEDYEEMTLVMREAYTGLTDAVWKKHQIKKLTELFPRGQVALFINGELAGCALAIIVDYSEFDDSHTYREITGNYTFKTHTPKGNLLYGIDIFVRPKYRGLRLGRRMYDYRKELCEELNLEGILFGGRLPKYHLFAETLSPRQFIEKVKAKEIHDPVLNFQFSNDFYIKKIITNYLSGDSESLEYAALLQWNNVLYAPPTKSPSVTKSVVRLGLVQWQMRTYRELEDLLQQVEYFVDTVSVYRSDFALFPEFFNAPLMAAYNHLSEPEAIRMLAKFTEPLRKKFSELSVAYNINIITGSMPMIEDGVLYNVGFLCRRDGTVDRFTKIHVTPDEAKVWGMSGGNTVRTFDTDCGKIGILICYDVEFPELPRIMAQQGMNILFVPFLTDTQNGYSRVRHCAQARAIENECYVAIAGSVGNLPKVHNMDIQYAQSMVFTPCDFAFPSNGIKAEATPNTEMILVADVDLDLLKELHHHGSVHNLRDRRTDVYRLELK